jgi:Glycolipid transfer protein (GLTP)
MEFVVAMLQRLHDDLEVPLPQAASEAYYATLHQYHGWITSAAFIVALKASLHSCWSEPL